MLKSRINAAASFNTPYFVTGSFRVTDNVYQITSRIHRTSDGAVLHVRYFKGKDFFGLIDSISLQARKDLGIRTDILNSSPDLPAREHITDNLNAFRYFIDGIFGSDLYKNLGMAIRIDSTFAWASFNTVIIFRRAR